LKDFHERFGDAFESEPQKSEKNVRRLRPLARIAIIAAALCAFVFTAQATGLDIFGAIARWTSEQFSFVREGEIKGPDQKLAFDTLQDALDQCEVTEKLSPTKFPEGTEMTDIRLIREKDGVVISSTYEFGEKKFYISVERIVGAPHMEVEINEADVEVYEIEGIHHHIMSDVKQRKAIWHNAGWECRISGNLTDEEKEQMMEAFAVDTGYSPPTLDRTKVNPSDKTLKYAKQHEAVSLCYLTANGNGLAIYAANPSDEEGAKDYTISGARIWFQAIEDQAVIDALNADVARPGALFFEIVNVRPLG